MVYNLIIDGTETECMIQDNKVILGGTTGTTVDVLDILNVHEDGDSEFKIHIINKSKNPIWKRCVIRGSGDSDTCARFICEIKDIMKQVTSKPRKFLVMVNPIGGAHSGEKSYKDIVAPVFDLAGIVTEVIVSKRPKHVIDIMTSYDFHGTDGVVLCGGDGTYHECISTLIQRFQNEAGIDVNDINAPIKPLPLPVAMIPTGTGNLIARSNYGTDDIETAALHIVRGQTKRRCICSYYEYGRLLTYAGQSFAYGDLAEMLYKMNRTRGWMGIKRMFILVYYFLFKRRKQYQVEIEFTNKHIDNESKSEEHTQNEDVGIREHSGVLRGNYFHISSLIDDFTDENFLYDFRLQDTQSTCLSLFKPCGRWDLMSHFKGLVQNTPDIFKRDFIQNVKFTRYKFKLLDIEGESSGTDEQNRIIAVDGETVKIAGKEFECRWHKDIIPVYSSC